MAQLGFLMRSIWNWIWYVKKLYRLILFKLFKHWRGGHTSLLILWNSITLLPKWDKDVTRKGYYRPTGIPPFIVLPFIVFGDNVCFTNWRFVAGGSGAVVIVAIDMRSYRPCFSYPLWLWLFPMYFSLEKIYFTDLLAVINCYFIGPLLGCW